MLCEHTIAGAVKRAPGMLSNRERECEYGGFATKEDPSPNHAPAGHRVAVLVSPEATAPVVHGVCLELVRSGHDGWIGRSIKVSRWENGETWQASTKYSPKPMQEPYGAPSLVHLFGLMTKEEKTWFMTLMLAKHSPIWIPSSLHHARWLP